MSAIFGLVYFVDRPKEYIERSLDKMGGAMLSWAPDGITQKILKPAGFAQGLLSLQTEDRYLQIPAISENQTTLFTTAARLDNREELLDVFDIHLNEREWTPDAKMVQLSVEKWGHDASEHLFGDWSYVKFQKNERTVTAARDHIGNTALYYYFDSKMFAFSTSPMALLVLDEIPTDLDEYRLACDMARIPALDAAYRTKWKAIHQLLPAQKLVANADSLHIETYWNLENVNPIRYKNESEYLEEFREKLSGAVNVRLKGNKGVGSSHSSGLDSGAITSLASKQLHHKNQELLAYTSVPAYSVDHKASQLIYDEWKLAHRVAEKYDNIRHIPIVAKNSNLAEQLKEIVEQFGDTVLSPGNAFWIFDMLKNAKKEDLGILLTGQLGNGGISWYGGRNRVLYQLLYEDPGKGLRALKESVSHFGISWKKALKFYVLNPFYSPLKQHVKTWIRPGKQLYLESSPVNREFAKRIGLDKRIRQSDFFGYKRSLAHPEKERVLTVFMNSNYTCASWHRYGAMFNMEVRDPSADVRLLEFCFGVPDTLHANNAQTRLLLRNSMKGVVPNDILANEKRGLQAADLDQRFLHQIDDISFEVNELKGIPGAKNYLDLDGIENSLTVLKKEEPENGNIHSTKVLRALMFGYFLRHELEIR